MIRFGAFELDDHSKQLSKKGARIRLQAKPLQLLFMLVERAGEIITREEFHKALSVGDTFGEFDHNLNNAINKLRRALNDHAATPRYIETLPRIGYRFLAPVERSAIPVTEPSAGPAAQPPTNPAPSLPESSGVPVARRDFRFVYLAAACLCAVAMAAVGFRYGWERDRTAVAQGSPALESVRKDPEAYEYYLKGRYFWNKRNQSEIKLAISYFQEALATDSNYALAYSGLADSYSVLGMTTSSPRELYQKARAAAMTSVKLDENSAEAHASLGLVYLCEWKFADSNREFQHAIAINPRYATVHHWYGLQLRDVGRLADGLKELELGHRLDPMSLPISFALANAYRKDGYTAQAEKQFAEIVKFDSTFRRVNAGLALLYASQHRLSQALASNGPFAISVEDDPAVLEYVAVGLYQAGQKKEAAQLIAKVTEHDKPPQGQCFPLLLAAMGEKDQSIQCLEQGYAERAGYISQIKTEPVLRELRSDPRFVQLLQRVGFPGGIAAPHQ